ncbi:MAG: CRISPR-associated endonuclease Cas1 [Vicinamibacterales bacterium]
MSESAQPQPPPATEPQKPRSARMALEQAGLPDYLPARMVNEFVYCPRLFFYEWVEGVFAHSADTLEGASRHDRVDAKPEPLPEAGEPRDDDAPVKARSVSLSSERHRLTATIDLVEASGSSATPVDYKKGRPKEGAEGPEAWPADRVQLGVQALVLRDNGYDCTEAIVYYSATKQRVRIAVDDILAETLAAVEAARAVAAKGVIPPPLVDSPKCPRCSLVGICLPDETHVAERNDPLVDSRQLALFESPVSENRADGEVRRLVPARDDRRPLYVIGQGMSVGKSGEVLQVRDRERRLVQEARLMDVSQVNLFGNVGVTTQAIQTLCGAEKTIAYYSTGGWFYGLTQGLALKNVFLRAEQFRKSSDPLFARAVARRLVAAKIRNQRTLLQRNHVEPPRIALRRMKALAQSAEAAESLETLLGLEGTAARLYFEHFGGMIKVDDEAWPAFSFEHRNRRPPKDPTNALLSLAYALLAKDLTIVSASVGFDPYWGFYHQPRFGRPALALDLMEMFRPLIADSAVLSAINTRMVTEGDFIRVGQAVSLTAAGRKGLLRAYEQRADGLVTHPLFDYRVSYRRVLEIQTRLLARFVMGEVDYLPTFETR